MALAALVAVGVGLSPAGATVGHWVREAVGWTPAPRRVQPALGALPAHGRLLVVARTGPWILQADGTRRRLGAYEDAAFSPRGLYAAVTRGRLLTAVDPRGGVRWTLTRPARVSAPAWAPDGFRVAYRSGRALRVVYGDGARDRRLSGRSAPVTPAWEPGAGHRLAFADGARVVVRDADEGGVRWRTPPIADVRELAWSPRGDRLLVLTPGAVRAFAADGRPSGVTRAPAGTRMRRMAWVGGGRFAVLRTDGDGTRSEVLLARPGRPAGRRLLAVPGRLGGVLGSPDGRWLLLTAPDARQWLLVRTAGPGRLTALSEVARQFDPGGRGRPPVPRPVAWIR